MDKQKVVVVLLVIAIVMSVVSVVINVAMNSGMSGFSLPRNTITNYFYKTDTSQSNQAGSIGITILPNRSGK